ncbi:hypothetical protein [Streptomyces variegatus]|uniref:hypothetical protein n=1 Tax=Streptomyces variegatus TaxID=284040 RepID=UPI003C2CFC30
MAQADPTIGPMGPLKSPTTKPGPDGTTLRRRWALTGTRPQVWGHAEFESRYVPDDGTPDDVTEHRWDVDPELPPLLIVTGWAYRAVEAEYVRLWAERQAERDAMRPAPRRR